jgi:hypothetical protein
LNRHDFSVSVCAELLNTASADNFVTFKQWQILVIRDEEGSMVNAEALLRQYDTMYQALFGNGRQ